MRNLQKVEGKMNKKESIKVPDESLRLGSCWRLLWTCCEYGLELPSAQTWLLGVTGWRERHFLQAAWALPDMRANIAVFSEGWCAGRMRFKWPAQVFFRFHFLKTASVGDTSRNSVPQLWEKSTHILRLILPKSHNNCHSICCMKCCFIHSCNILCIYTTQSPACFGNQACIEKRVPDISIL